MSYALNGGVRFLTGIDGIQFTSDCACSARDNLKFKGAVRRVAHAHYDTLRSYKT